MKAFGNAEVLAGLEEYESVYEEYSTKIQSVLSSDSNSMEWLFWIDQAEGARQYYFKTWNSGR